MALTLTALLGVMRIIVVDFLEVVKSETWRAGYESGSWMYLVEMARRPLTLMDGTSLGGIWTGVNDVKGDRFYRDLWCYERRAAVAGRPAIVEVN